MDAKYNCTLREPMVKVIHSMSAVDVQGTHMTNLSCSNNFRMSLANSPSLIRRSSTFTFLNLSFSESEGGAMSECARACAYGLPPTVTVDGLEIEAVL